MAKKKGNERCPLQAECEKVCQWQGRELDCLYYEANARDGYEIEDQEVIRRERWRQGEFGFQSGSEFRGGDSFFSSFQDVCGGFCEDEDEFAESPTAAENAAVTPLEGSDDDLFPAEVLPSSLHLDGSNGVTEKIKHAMYDAARQFVYIGFLLWEVQEFGYYNEKGYASVYEYAEKELGFKKSSTKNFIAINYEFGCRNGLPRGIAHQRTMSLQPQYQQFNYSQLCEMLSMSDKQREKVTPDMTVKQIRELKREVEPDLPPDMETIPIPLSDDPVPSGQTSGRDETFTQSCLLNNFWVDIPAPLLFDLFKLIVAKDKVRYNPRSCYDITIKLHKDT